MINYWIFSALIVGFFHLQNPILQSTIIENRSSMYFEDTIPELNELIINFVKAHLKKKVGRGECWDLAAEALNHSGARWNQQFKFGKEVHYQRDTIYPGDIIQFENVLLQYEKNGQKFKENMDHHTAIIYEILGPGNFLLAHQNTEFSGRKVGLSPINLQNRSRGHIKIYRPVR